MKIEEVQAAIRKFRDERDWKQFHNPKDMATAIAIEAAELQEIFLWKSADEVDGVSIKKRQELEDEIADVAAYLFELADNLNIDLGKAVLSKLEKNALKYPVEKAKGSNAKYNEL
ncbi:MAG: nucleotide pyrophosphohydrolase [Chthoniobacterales bacterium]